MLLMRGQLGRFSQLAVVATIISFLMAYFVKPHPTQTELVPSVYTQAQKGVVTVPLAQRLARSYALAMILVRSDYTPSNADALEALRNWANQNYEKDSHFLHPAAIDAPEENTQSVVDSYSFSLFGAVRYGFEDLMASFLRWRVSDFVASDSYKSFSDDYYSIFGRDFETEQLLLRYQNDRARLAIDPMLVASFWLLTAISIAWSLWIRRGERTSDRIQFALSWTWLALSAFYIVASWTQNLVSVLVSAMICLAIGLYLRRPIKVELQSDHHGISIKPLHLSAPVLSLLTWLTVSLLLIRVVTWIKTGSLVHSDPVTLLIAGLRGDFIHDPVHVKRIVDRTIGLLWLVFTLWTIPRLGGEWTAEAAQEEPLRAIQKPLY